MEGYVKIHRKIIEWEWFKEHNTYIVFSFLLMDCNFKPTKWKGIELMVGETVKSIQTLSDFTNLTLRKVRTALHNLKTTGEVTERYHGRIRILKVKNYKQYQLGDTTDDIQTTSKRHSIKNVKNVKKVKREIFFDYGKYVRLTEKQYAGLCQDYSLDIITEKIDTMNEHLGMHGKKPYSDYNLAIRNWLRREGVGKLVDWGQFKNDEEIAKYLKDHPEAMKQAEKEKPTAWNLSRFI